LTILGGGHPDYELQLRMRVDELGVGDHVVFAGRVSRDEIPTWLGRFDVFLFTSIWAEPMARAVMEAMAAGLLVIGSEVGGQVEMLEHNHNALTFQAEDAVSLAQRIEYLLLNPQVRSSLARSGQSMVLARFTLERMVDDMERWLAGIMSNQPTQSTVPSQAEQSQL
jgi:glycosyltransferase involved in cell wall biosynthesis